MKITQMEKEDFKEKSYWLTTREYTPNVSLKEEIDTDVAIIGGGFTGQTTAYFLKQAEPGTKVTILEGQVIGFGASGRKVPSPQTFTSNFSPFLRSAQSAASRLAAA